MLKAIRWLPLLLCLLSCNNSMKAPDYVRYVNDRGNGLKKTIEVDGFAYEVQFRPYDYIVLMENKGRQAKETGKRLSELKGTAWFNISIRRQDNAITPLRYGLSSLEQYNVRLGYYLNEAQKDIWLRYGDDTLHPVSYLFENNYNLSPQETMVVGFYLPQGQDYPQKDMQLSYNDRVFKNGIIKATYSEKTLKNIPTAIN